MASFSKAEQFLAARAAEASERQKAALEAERESAVDPIVVTEASAEMPSATNATRKSRKGIARKIVKRADDRLMQGEQLGLFTSLMIEDTNRIPTLLARLPIFVPIPARVQRDQLDADLAFHFETPFGRGRRFGPPVTIEDEDVLFAMLQLSGRRLIGKGTRLPIPLSDHNWLTDRSGNLTVQVMIATVGQINNALGINDSGVNYKATLASIKRLAHIGIELETRKTELYLGESWSGQTIRLVDIQWRSFSEEGLIFAQFSPIMVRWLREQATFQNWKIRRQIKSANGRALYRFLCTQGKYYRQELEYIADVIHWYGDRSRLKPRMEAVLTQLRDSFEWCDFEIHGTGRSKPFVLEFWRRRQP